MSNDCPHTNLGWWSGANGVRHCMSCGLPISIDSNTTTNADRPRPNLRLIKGGKEERDVHDRDLPGGAA